MRPVGLLALLLASFVLACGGDDTGGTTIEDTSTAELPPPIDTFEPADTHVAADTSGPVDTTIPTDAAPGTLGAPCSENSECLSGWCVASDQGPVCTRECIDDCPGDWQCLGIPGQIDVTFLCVPRQDRLCQPCAVDGQCHTGYCLTLAEGRRCTAACEDESDCPPGYACQLEESEELEGRISTQCVPANGACDCVPGKEGFIESCSVGNEHGTCFGIRTCLGATGWGPCDARVPAPEVCDGVDNNCNGLIDEGLGGHPCDITNEHGTCVGTTACLGADGITCVGQVPAPEVCNYLDDNCSGLTDEDFPDVGTVCSAGVGVCQRFGVHVCTPDGSGTTCTATPGAPGVESCNLQDDNCNGITDDGFQVDGRYILDETCGNCFTDCTAIFDRPNAYGTCNTAPATPVCALTCCRVGDVEAACDGANDYYDLNAVPDDGCEFRLDTGAIYVSTSSAAAQDVQGCGLGPVGTGPGGGHFPCRTIGFGIQEAARLARSRVRVADGLYTEPVTLVEGISLLGGHRADTWERSVAATNTTIRGASAAGPHRRTIVADGITTLETLVEGFIIDGPTTFTASGNSYAVWIRDSSAAVRIEGNIIFGGFGGDGAHSGAGGQGADGGHGQRGERSILTSSHTLSGCQAHADTPGNVPSCFDSVTNQKTSSACGARGTNTCGGSAVHGGAGAGAVCPVEINQQAGGAVGLSAGGLNGGPGGGGAGGHDRVSSNCGTFGSGGFSATGLPGGDGVRGADANGGVGCANVTGSVSGGHWQGAVGQAGPAGRHGGGGGGGGAGGGADVTINCMSTFGDPANDTLGGSGGGGGAGGCGGTGGLGGQPGGGTFAVFITRSAPTAIASFPVVTGNTITRGVGGDGGNGGPAGRGGLGGNGGDGGLVFGPWGYAMGNGGRGGQGGDGGHGGGGGGGCGGVSYGVYVHNAIGAPSYHTVNAFMPGGDGGQGGAGGASVGQVGLPGSQGIGLDWSW